MDPTFDTLAMPETLCETQDEMRRAERIADICGRHHDRDSEVFFRNRLARLRLHERHLRHRLGCRYTQNSGCGAARHGEPVNRVVSR